jgi:hypothetical protein
MSVGFCSNSRAMFACERMAAVAARDERGLGRLLRLRDGSWAPSSRRRDHVADPSETTTTPAQCARPRAPSSSRATTSYSPEQRLERARPDTARSASCLAVKPGGSPGRPGDAQRIRHLEGHRALSAA